MSEDSQKEIVYTAVVAFLQENNRTIDGNPVVLSKDDKNTLITMLQTALEVGEMKLSAKAQYKYDTPKKIQTYLVGLLSNWLSRDSRLNGGANAAARNPGSKVGQNDSVVKSLKALKDTVTSIKEKNIVSKEIEKRIQELKNNKSKNKG